MKKFIYLIFLLVLTFILKLNVYASDVTQNFSIKNIKACSDVLCSTEYDETNGMPETTFLVKFDWEYVSNEEIKSGDTVIIPFANEINTSNTIAWGGSLLSSTALNDSRGNKIGTISISGSGENRKLKIVFSDYSVGKNSLNGTFYTPKNIKSSFTYNDIIVPLSVGDNQLNILLKAQSKEEFASDIPYIYQGGSSNDIINWRTTAPGNALAQLYRYEQYKELTNNVILNDLMLEMIIPSNASIKNFSVNARIVFPTDKINHYASPTGFFVDAHSLFTEVKQNEFETYADFKNRISEIHYGIYTDKETNNKIIIVNFGSQPSNGITYSQALGETSLKQFMFNYNPFLVDEEIAEIIDNAIGENNIINNRIGLWNVVVNLNYPKVYTDTKVTQSATWSYKNGLGENKTIRVQGTGTLTAATSTAEVKGTSKLILLDKSNMLPISGAEFTLQKYNNDSWEDVQSGLVTDESGVLTIPNLENGEYRYVQTKYLEHYIDDSYKSYSDSELDTEIDKFILNEDGNTTYVTNEREIFEVTYKPGEHGDYTDSSYNVHYGDSLPSFTPTSSDGWIFIGWDITPNLIVTEDATYTAMWEKKVKLIVHHYILGTTIKIVDDVESIKNSGDSYETSISRNVPSKYILDSIYGNASGTIGENDLDIIYYYKLKPATLVVNHLEENTNKVLSTQVVDGTLHYDDPYITEEATDIPNYELKRTQGNVSGVINSDVVEVTYYYAKRDSNVLSDITVTGPDEITNKDQKNDYEIKYTSKIENYIGTAKVKLSCILPYTIVETESDIDGGVYNSDDKTITWIIDNDINSYNGEDIIEITKNISLVYNVNSEDRRITVKSSGETTLDNNTKVIENNTNTEVKIKGRIIVKYIDIDTSEELDETITSEDLVGKLYSTNTKNFEGYKIVSKPETEVYTFKDEVQEVIYKYNKITYNIDTKVNGKGGTITGNEIVKYGEDSTKDNIIVKADKGYCIQRVLVNGEEIKIKGCKTKMTLDNFKDVKEDINVEVSFIEKTNNPNTLDNIVKYCSLLLFSTTMIVSLLLLRRKIKISK